MEIRSHIRQAAADDITELVVLNAALFQEDGGTRDPYMNLNWPKEEGGEYFLRLVLGTDSVCFLAEHDGVIIGYLAGYIRKWNSLRPIQIAELESMYIKRAYRCRGAGTQLANHFLKWSIKNGALRISVTAYAANWDAIGFYRRLGFEPMNLSLEIAL